MLAMHQNLVTSVIIIIFSQLLLKTKREQREGQVLKLGHLGSFTRELQLHAPKDTIMLLPTNHWREGKVGVCTVKSG